MSAQVALEATNFCNLQADFARFSYFADNKGLVVSYSLPVPTYGFDRELLKRVDGAVGAEIDQAVAEDLEGLLK